MPRQKAAPQQNREASLVVSSRPPREEEELSEDEYDVTRPPPPTRRREEEEEGGGSHRPPAAKKAKVATTTAAAGAAAQGEEEGEEKPSKKPAAPRSVLTSKYGGGELAFDAEALASDYLAAADAPGTGGTGALGGKMHQQLLTAARLEAARKGGTAVDIRVKEAKGDAEDGSPGRPTVTVAFKFNRKPFQDSCPLYDADEAAAIFAGVLRRQSTKRRKAGASHPSVKIDEVARRSPPLFWSLFHGFYADVDKGLATVLAAAEAMAADEDT